MIGQAGEGEAPGTPIAIGPPVRGCVLAFDFGRKRIGVAVGELELRLAHPVETIDSEVEAVRDDAISRLVREWSPVLFVVGLPHQPDGTAHPLARACRRFARRLEARFGLPVAFVDERFTSHAASLALNDAGVRGRRQKAMLDQVAAQQILQDYFGDGDGAA